MSTSLDTFAPICKKVHKLKFPNTCVSYVTILIQLFADDLSGFSDDLNNFYAWINFYLVLESFESSYIPIFNDKNHYEILDMQTIPFCIQTPRQYPQKKQTAGSILSPFFEGLNLAHIPKICLSALLHEQPVPRKGHASHSVSLWLSPVCSLRFAALTYQANLVALWSCRLY